MAQTSSMLSEAARARRQKAVGQALAASRGDDMSQTELSARIRIPQTTVSRWERGTVDLTMEQALEIEIALGLKPGTLAEAGGYIAAGGESSDASAVAIEALIRRCPDIDSDLRLILVTSLKQLVSTTRRLNRTESIVHLPTAEVTRRRRSRTAAN